MDGEGEEDGEGGAKFYGLSPNPLISLISLTFLSAGHFSPKLVKQVGAGGINGNNAFALG